MDIYVDITSLIIGGVVGFIAGVFVSTILFNTGNNYDDFHWH